MSEQEAQLIKLVKDFNIQTYDFNKYQYKERVYFIPNNEKYDYEKGEYKPPIPTLFMIVNARFKSAHCKSITQPVSISVRFNTYKNILEFYCKPLILIFAFPHYKSDPLYSIRRLLSYQTIHFEDDVYYTKDKGKVKIWLPLYATRRQMP